MSIRDAIQIFETSPGLYAVRVSYAGQVRETIEVTRDDAWAVGCDMLADIIDSLQDTDPA